MFVNRTHNVQSALISPGFPRLTCNLCLAFTCCVGSSLYYDEDGDLAHEFYEETVVTKNGRKKSKLKRIHKNLIPQVREGHITPVSLRLKVGSNASPS